MNETNRLEKFLDSDLGKDLKKLLQNVAIATGEAALTVLDQEVKKLRIDPSYQPYVVLVTAILVSQLRTILKEGKLDPENVKLVVNALS